MLTSNALIGAMVDLGIVMAVELGYESVFEPAVSDCVPSDADIAHALREPVSMAAVLMDLCRLLGIELPRIVALALYE